MKRFSLLDLEQKVPILCDNILPFDKTLLMTCQNVTNAMLDCLSSLLACTLCIFYVTKLYANME